LFSVYAREAESYPLEGVTTAVRVLESKALGRTCKRGIAMRNRHMSYVYPLFLVFEDFHGSHGKWMFP